CALLMIFARSARCQKVIYDPPIPGFSYAVKGDPAVYWARVTIAMKAQVYVIEGQKQLAERRYSSAESLFTLALQIEPYNEIAQLSLALTYTGQGKKYRAADAFRALVYKPNPGNVSSDPTTMLDFVLL